MNWIGYKSKVRKVGQVTSPYPTLRSSAQFLLFLCDLFCLQQSVSSICCCSSSFQPTLFFVSATAFQPPGLVARTAVWIVASDTVVSSRAVQSILRCYILAKLSIPCPKRGRRGIFVYSKLNSQNLLCLLSIKKTYAFTHQPIPSNFIFLVKSYFIPTR